MAKNNRNGDGFKPIPRVNGHDKQYVKMSFYVLNSEEYKSLSASAKVVMQAMQMQHRTHCYTSYGRKQAAGVTGLNTKTITKVFNSLLEKGWLVITQGYNHLEGKTRVYELTWMSYNGKKPRDLWKKKIKKVGE